MTESELSNTTRPAAGAGKFDPQESHALADMIQTLLAQADKNQPNTPHDQTDIRAIVAPHAGYIYSGPVAASAYHYIRQSAQQIDRVIILGPAHRVPLQGCACPTSLWFETPLGKIPLAQDLLQNLIDQGLLHADNQAHQYEHSLEVQLPFIQTLCHHFSLLPILVGNCSADKIVAIIDALYNEKSLLIISTDRKSTRLNSSHLVISYAVFCLKKKKKKTKTT